ncbi:hypothetical protein CHUAL_005574 [Chamberlinius hualienensis]
MTSSDDGDSTMWWTNDHGSDLAYPDFPYNNYSSKYNLSELFNSSIGNLSDDAMTTPCTNDYCVSDDDYIELIRDYIYPSNSEWIVICLHCVVFVVGLIGNFLVALAVFRNPTMQTVTNYFIVNLALADFFVILVCLPPTVLWDVTETWFFGSALCKTVLYIQTVSITVSVLTLTFISIDRWYAICYPLKFKSTTGRAKVAIFIIWFVSLMIVLPDLVVLDTRPSERLRVETIYLTECYATWSAASQKTYQIILLLLLYIAPFLLMSIAYNQIFKVLWRNSMPSNSNSKVNVTKSCSSVKKSLRSGCSTMSTTTSVDGKVRSRRKAAKMLIAVVIMFGVCYFPVHLMNVLRYSIGLPQNELTATLSLFSHWLCYANSAMNPIIYNIMSGKFRKEFKKTFFCCLCCCCDLHSKNPKYGRRGLANRNYIGGVTSMDGGTCTKSRYANANNLSCKYTNSTIVSHAVTINLANMTTPDEEDDAR